jgi:hypothetical protein
MNAVIILLCMVLWSKTALPQTLESWPDGFENGTMLDGIHGSSRLEDWPPNLADRARGMHRDFCRRLDRMVRFVPFGGKDCERFQEAFLGSYCGSQGQSLRQPSAASCLPELQQDLNWWLDEMASEMPNRSRGGVASMQPPPSPALAVPRSANRGPSPVPAVPMSNHRIAMPPAVSGRDLSPHSVFAGSRQAIWILRAISSRTRGGVIPNLRERDSSGISVVAGS